MWFMMKMSELFLSKIENAKIRARTNFKNEFKSTSTIREILREFHSEIQSRNESNYTPNLSYSTGKHEQKVQIKGRMLDVKIGKLATNRDSFLVYVDLLQN
ncbi:unnamed protein product [Caenorhabditis angaria]|uniref:Uncharacterized protein n=1 Tax=Caenorhabditis angaria TaxID=860376 RepID=A0A9P1IS20_9PELO|nr:unnamed protein product [Caenorhabditis angaria]